MADNTKAFLATALPRLAESAAREHRLAASARAEIGRLLASEELRKLADSDAELNTSVTRAGGTIAAEDKAAAAWQKALAEATKQWQASLTELSKLHG